MSENRRLLDRNISSPADGYGSPGSTPTVVSVTSTSSSTSTTTARHHMIHNRPTSGIDNGMSVRSSSNYHSGTDTTRTQSTVDELHDSLSEEDDLQRRKTKAAFILVLVTETLERAAFYGIICNMVMFLNLDPLHWESYNAAGALFALNGLSYITAVFGGWLADSYFGKFKTIIIFFFVYLCGFMFWPFFYPFYEKNSNAKSPPAWCASATSLSNMTTLSPNGFSDISDKMEQCAWAVFLSIAITAIGFGTVRVNLIPFGAHQEPRFEVGAHASPLSIHLRRYLYLVNVQRFKVVQTLSEVEHEGKNSTRLYFNWFYWCVNIGAFISYCGIAYVQQEISYFWGFIAPNAALLAALVVFIFGSCIYIKKPATGSILTNIYRILRESFWLCCRRRRHRPEQEQSLTTDIVAYDAEPPCCLDYAKVRYGRSFHNNLVEDVKVLGKVLVVFMSLVPYWIVYYQMQTTFVVQGLHMKLDFDNNDTMAAADSRPFKIPTAWLSLFDVVFILLILPVFDRVIYPYLDRVGRSPSLRARILFGMVFSFFGMLTAGALEMYRLDIYWFNGTNHTHWQKIGSTYFQAADLTVLWQVPQYALIGLSEVFTSIASLELAYIYAPQTMQGIIMGLYWFTQGLGSLLGTAIIMSLSRIWFSTYDHGNINCQTSPFRDSSSKCHLDYYFFLLAGLQLIGMIIFGGITWKMGIGYRTPLRVRQRWYTVIRPSTDAEHSEGRSSSRGSEVDSGHRSPAGVAVNRSQSAYTGIS